MASRAFLKSLEKGQILHAQVEEVTSPTELLCNFQGELLLIFNHTGSGFKKNDPISLQVLSINPLRFQVFSPSSPKFQRVV
ncbi:hypothetical protein Bdt_0597 [Bdellovibrio bacteriovorus str. Tiberius]|uniref:Uncharacterized protein n=1 Tax=Bdellovibrio bacteriovorus str. Tiberius TaxID=1069642 RepID=K7YUH5_BDEBC|nr:hypothetical protein Bdt_0597 [Bdellovibrio bacteriovorus str. Tiberius]